MAQDIFNNLIESKHHIAFLLSTQNIGVGFSNFNQPIPSIY